MEKVVKINGKNVGLRANGLTPVYYRAITGRDAIADMKALEQAHKKVEALPKDADEDERLNAQFDYKALSALANMAYVMARTYDGGIAKTRDEWLEFMPPLVIYELAQPVLELWQFNNATTAKPKKK